jgi:hypothetical protein
MDRSVVWLICDREMPGEHSRKKKHPAAIAVPVLDIRSMVGNPKDVQARRISWGLFLLVRLVKGSKQGLEFGLSSCQRG